jgi:hypothetical protein
MLSNHVYGAVITEKLTADRLIQFHYLIHKVSPLVLEPNDVTPLLGNKPRRLLYAFLKILLMVKVKFTLEQAMKAQKGSRVIAVLFFLTFP